jgi:hypothetical protein
MNRNLLPPLTEPVPAPEFFASGRTFDVREHFVRVYFWTEQPLEIGGDRRLCPIERPIAVKVIMPTPVWMSYRYERWMPANKA